MTDYEEIDLEDRPPEAEVSHLEWTDEESFGVYLEIDGEVTHHFTAHVAQLFKKKD